MATSCAKLVPGNWPGTGLATSGTLFTAGGLGMLIFCNGEVMVTLKSEGGIPALGTGDGIEPLKQGLFSRNSSRKDVSENGHAGKVK